MKTAISTFDDSIATDKLAREPPRAASAMAKPDEPESLVWGTLEELLLACAIHRYGTDSWESVAKEVQKRSSAASHSFTSHNCKRKYYDLKHRFASQTDLVGGAAAEGGGGDSIPWLDELRRRRIAELKRDLERFDLSIGSLQLKLKRLSEEREKLSTESERKASDLQRAEKREKGDGRDEEEGEKPPLPDAEDRAPAVESDRENHSVNASISSEQRGEKSAENRDESAGKKNPAEPAADSPADSEEVTAKPACEDSKNGSSDTVAVAKGPARSAKAETVCNSPELVESLAESKRGEEEEGLEKVKSEVRSLASLSGGKGRCESIYLSKSGTAAENQCAADNCASVKPQPLADLLDVIRHHKFGSVFERRLDSQESSKYKNMIRQHLDLATIRKRLEEGAYSECHSKFYRDLLLLATNATLFFPESAPEHNSAIELRRLVSTKLPSKPKPKTPFIDSPLFLTSPVIACRKRSLVVLKPPSGENKRDINDEKPSWLSTVTKKRTGDQSSSVSRTEENTEVKHKKNHHDNTNNNNADTSLGERRKKKSVRNFLNRIRGSSTDSMNSGGSGSKSEEKGKDNGKSSCKGSSPLSAKEKGKQNGEDSKRNNGRPPKRAAAVAGMGKRRRDGGGDKAEGALPKKRSRK